MASRPGRKLPTSALRHYLPIVDFSSEYSTGYEVICIPHQHIPRTSVLSQQDLRTLRRYLVMVKIVVDEAGSDADVKDIFEGVRVVKWRQTYDNSFKSCGLVEVLQLDYDPASNTMWYSTPFLQGCSLDQIPRQISNPITVCHIITSIYYAWRYLHRKDIRHGSWHSGNIMLMMKPQSALPTVTVIDYRSVQQYDDEDDSEEITGLVRNLFIALGIWEGIPEMWRNILSPADLEMWEEFYEIFHGATGETGETIPVDGMSVEWVWWKFGGMIERISRQLVPLGTLLPVHVQNRLRQEFVTDDEILQAIHASRN